LCKDAYFASLDRRLAKLRCLTGLVCGDPLSFTYFRHPGLRAWTVRTLNEIQPDVVFINSSNMAQYVLDQPFRPRRLIMDFVDLDSDKWRAYAARARSPWRWVYAREAERVCEQELRIAAAADASVFVSDAEAALFRQLAPHYGAKTQAISNGVDVAYFTPQKAYQPPYDPSLPTYVFTGMMDYWPNIDAVAWFARELLPAIRLRVHEAQFYIVGARPSPAVQALAELPGVHVSGRVPDVRPYLHYATAAVAPLRVARGIQNKVLEAMAMAKPTIVTPAALAGINAQPGKEVLLAEDAQGLVAAASRLANGFTAHELGAAARARVVADYSWEAHLAQLDRLLAV
jgi:sugar transferase (PEP-CTERM/EpsH1 system associated)